MVQTNRFSVSNNTEELMDVTGRTLSGHQTIHIQKSSVFSAGTIPMQPKRTPGNDVESIALRHLVTLKAALRNATRDEFWSILCSEFGNLAQCQDCFVTRRSFVLPGRNGVKTLPVDSDTSPLSIISYYHNDVLGNTSQGGHAFLQPYSPKSSTVPSRSLLVPNVQDERTLFVEWEWYISIPLQTSEGYAADFWMVWSRLGASKRCHSSGFLQLAFRTLEDIVAQKLLESSPSSTYKLHMPLTPPENELIERRLCSPTTTGNSLERYAKKISHELRTPLQGIMGLTELMHAAVHDASSNSSGESMRTTLQTLKEDLEAVQSSSRRAADAADNFIQAYELNLLLPEVTAVPTTEGEDPAQSPKEIKRRHSESDCRQQCSRIYQTSTPPRQHQSDEAKQYFSSPPPRDSSLPQRDDAKVQHRRDASLDTPQFLQSAGHGLQLTDVRRCTKDIVNDCIKREGSLGLVIPYDSARGQKIEIHALASNGETRVKTVIWDVHSDVPEFILVEQRDMAKMISCVLQNALKFTEEGSITLQIYQSPTSSAVMINVKDTGPGISPEFRREIFKPFSQEDDSTTRSKEGLGLGLVVAKGLAKRLRGDLCLVSADTEGPYRGTQFTMQVPISPNAESSPMVESIEDPMKSFIRAPLTEGHQQSKSTDKGFGIDPDRRGISLNPASVPEIGHRPNTPAKRRYSQISIPQSDPTPPQEEDESAPKRPTLALSQHDNAEHRKPLPPRRSNVTSHPSTGFREPAKPQPTTQGAPEAPPKPKHNLAATHPLNFLVAEDNVVNRKMLVKMLVKLGYDARTQIREASDGVEAVRQVKASAPAQPLPGRRCSSAPPLCTSPDDETHAAPDADAAPTEPIDVILMDLWMPNMDGYEAAERILEICKPRPTPAAAAASRHDSAAPLILAVTADATQASLERAARAGMGGLMLKPYGLRDLERLVREGWTRRQKGAADALGPRFPLAPGWGGVDGVAAV